MSKSTRTTVLSTFTAALLGGVAAVGIGAAGNAFFAADARQPIVIEAPGGAPVSFADLIDQVSPAVVSVNVVTEREIDANQSLRDFFDQFRNRGDDEPDSDGDEDESPETRRGFGLGSGFFISADGFIVTNNHVIEDATEIEVVLSDGRELKARLVGADAETDLAVLQIEDEAEGPFPFVEFADSDAVRVGDWVVALGNPFGLGGTATAGIVSAKGGRDEPGRTTSYVDFLQVDASINRGNSGGPTFDLRGQVIGVNTAILSPSGGSVGIGFAIPSDTAETIVSRLKEDGKVTRGWMGVTIQSLSDEMAEALALPQNEGAIIADLVADGPAETSGLKRGDVVLALNGRKVTDSIDLTRQVGNLLAGTTNDFRVVRAGDEIVVKVKVGERPTDSTALENNRKQGSAPKSDAAVDSPLGVSLLPLDKDLRDIYGLRSEDKGVVVTSVERRGILAERGMLPGMVILSVNGRDVADPDAYAKQVEAAQNAGRENVLFSVLYQGRALFVTAPLKAD